MKNLTIISFFLLSFLQGFSRTLHVGKGKKFSSVKSALVEAVNGDTILVQPGIYYEKNLIIDKSIVLKGVGHPVFDGERKYEVISVKANGVVIDGLKVRRSGISSIDDVGGIKVYDSRDVVIKNNILEETFFGIYIQYGTNCTVKNNILIADKILEQDSGNGIHAWKSDSLRIIGNSISGHRDGIYFEFVTNSIIWRNIATGNIRYGLHFMFSNDDTYITNIFRNNGAGVAVMYSKRVKMFHNFFEENWGDGSYGLLLKEISDSHVEGNEFRKNTVGILMEGASRIEMRRNEFDNNGWAMKIQASCMEVNVHRNNFTGNTFDVGTNGSLVLNSFKNNYWDKYEGYDLNKDKIGDIPYRPVSMFSMLVERNPPAMMLFRSFITTLLDKSEKVFPSLTPEDLKDDFPLMKKIRQ